MSAIACGSRGPIARPEASEARDVPDPNHLTDPPEEREFEYGAPRTRASVPARTPSLMPKERAYETRNGLAERNRDRLCRWRTHSTSSKPSIGAEVADGHLRLPHLRIKQRSVLVGIRQVRVQD